LHWLDITKVLLPNLVGKNSFFENLKIKQKVKNPSQNQNKAYQLRPDFGTDFFKFGFRQITCFIVTPIK
jgi:hypothetical protein